jgi:hypothetical protein
MNVIDSARLRAAKVHQVRQLVATWTSKLISQGPCSSNLHNGISDGLAQE